MVNREAEKQSADARNVAPPLSPGVEEYLADVIGAVEATDFERHSLWHQNRSRKEPLSWEDCRFGYGQTVGFVGDMPVCVSLMSAVVDGHRVLFYHARSQVVDHRMIDAWLESNLPPCARHKDGRPNKSDASNMHNVLPRFQ